MKLGVVAEGLALKLLWYRQPQPLGQTPPLKSPLTTTCSFTPHSHRKLGTSINTSNAKIGIRMEPAITAQSRPSTETDSEGRLGSRTREEFRAPWHFSSLSIVKHLKLNGTFFDGQTKKV